MALDRKLDTSLSCKQNKATKKKKQQKNFDFNPKKGMLSVVTKWHHNT